MKKTTQPMKKTTRLSSSLPLPPPSSSSRSLLHSSAKGIPWWPAISESSSAWSYGKLMNWKMNRCRQRGSEALTPSWRWNSRHSPVDTQVFQAQVSYIFCTDVGRPAGRRVIVTFSLSPESAFLWPTGEAGEMSGHALCSAGSFSSNQ